MHLTGFNQAHTKDFHLRRVQIFQKWISSWFSECGHFAKIVEFFTSESANLTKEDLPWILSHFFVQKYIKFPIFQTSFARKQQLGGLFCRLGNLGGAMHPCTPPSINGHAFNIVLVIPYCTCTANPKLHKSDNCTKMQEAKLEFVYVHRGGCAQGWVLLKSAFLCKTSNFH